MNNSDNDLPSPVVWVFFYGSYVDESKLLALGAQPRNGEVALMPGYKISFQPMANLRTSENDFVYGLVAKLTHSELGQLYRNPLENKDERYSPVAVNVVLNNGDFRPALCYLADLAESRNPKKEYIDKIIHAATKMKIPSWYIDLLAKNSRSG